jgi:hypothetical protein
MHWVCIPSLTGYVPPLHFNLPLSLAPNETSHDHTLPPSSTCHPAIVSPIESHADTTNSSPTTPTESHGPTYLHPQKVIVPPYHLHPLKVRVPHHLFHLLKVNVQVHYYHLSPPLLSHMVQQMFCLLLLL